MANSLMLIPALIGALSGTSNTATLLSNLISAIGQESGDDGVNRLVAVHFKNGLSHLKNYELESAPEKRKRHAELARESFITAANIEKDHLRIAKADLYISSSSRLLGDRNLALYWAEQAYRELAESETFAWRIYISGPDPALTITPKIGGVAYFYPMCDFTHDQEIAFFTKLYTNVEHGKWYVSGGPAATDGTMARHSKLHEIYTYKEPLAAFLKAQGSTIQELREPITIPIDNLSLGAKAAVRLSDENCSSRAHKMP